MSLFGALNTAVSGLTAQSAAFGNIGDNVANSQTVGYKRVDTSFQDYLSTSTAAINQPGAVLARPDYVNTVEGTVTQTENTTNLAIAGQGFFNVSHAISNSNGTTVFGAQPEYTRTGDFSLNKDGYLVNSSGDYLNGWTVTNGTPDQTVTTPIQIGQSAYSPVPTKNATLAANLPASPDAAASFPTQIPITDSLGGSQKLDLTWTPASSPANTWSVSISQHGSTTPLGTATVGFGSDGTISSITSPSGSITAPTSPTGMASLGITANFGTGPQPITLNLGHFGQADGLTQYAGTTYSLRALSQDGIAPGSYNGVTMNPSGDVVVNYDNGQSRVVARVPVVTFADPNALQRENGQAFEATRESGAAQTMQSNTSGAGALVTSSVESSNVDIGKEFTKLIVAQQAYSANTKMVTTADQLLQSTINMKQ